MKKDKTGYIFLVAFIFLAVVFVVHNCKGQGRTPGRLAYNSLEVSYIALNVLDGITTYKVIDAGGKELNPIMKPFIGVRGEFIAVKTLSTFGILAINRAIRKDHPKAAFISLAVLNVGMGYVVNHNYQVYIRIKL